MQQREGTSMIEKPVFTRSGLQAAVTAAIAKERGRFAAIMALPAAAERQQLALTLATTTDQSVDQVKISLEAAPVATDGRRAAARPIEQPSGGNDNTGVGDASALWDASLKSRGFKIG
jgi:hypothetical protein